MIRLNPPDLPKLVKRLTPRTARIVACEQCGFERDASDDEIQYAEIELRTECPQGCEGGLTWKYVEADECRNCGKLGWWGDYPRCCCSRCCALQLEYAESLA